MNGSQMTDGQQQLDMQGFIGGLIGRTLGGFLGNKIGGSTGRTIGGIGGGALGALLPFSTGPDQMAAAGGQPTDIEMQGFFSTLRRLAPTKPWSDHISREHPAATYRSAGPEEMQ